jgi:site-specific DNA-adenine methylase
MNAIALEQKYKSPLQRYPGSKRGYLPKLWDECETEAVVEPFAGAAHYSFDRLNQGWILAPKQVFLGEQDKGVRAIYETWRSPETYSAFYTRLEFWRIEFCFTSADSAWKALVREIEEWSAAPELDSTQTAYFACAALALRKLTFGGVVRNNAKGKLNIKYCEGQVNELIGWNFIFPPIPEAGVSICSDWQSAIAAFKNSDLKSAEALIDPPYYAPKQKGKVCTAAYLGHEPHSDRTRQLCTKAFEACLMDGRFRLINVTNYFSDELDQELGAIALNHGVKLECRVENGLKSMNKSGKEKDGETEAIWTVRRAIA